MNLLLYGLYVFFAVTTVSAVFGTAVALTFAYLLAFSCLVAFLIKRPCDRLLWSEKLGIAMVAWLIISTLFHPNYQEGIRFILAEYRLILFWPLIALVLSDRLTSAQLWAPIVLGGCLHVIGTILLVIEKVFHHPSPLLGIQARGNPFALNGKFIQAWLVTLWSSMALFWLSWRPSKTRSFAVFCVFWLATFSWYHSLILVDARSAFFSVSAVLLILGGVAYFRFARICKLQANLVLASTLFFACAILFLHPPSGVLTAVENVKGFIFQGREDTSIGMRLLLWKRCSTLAGSEMFFGVGAGGWKDALEAWFPYGTAGRPFVLWNDFHSQLIWLQVKGGLVAVLLYVGMASSILLTSVKLLWVRKSWAVGGLGVGIFAILMVLGSMNSVFTALREAHLTFLAMILWSSLVRGLDSYARSATG